METSITNIVEKLISWHDEEVPGPHKVTIFPTDICNNNCNFCPREGNKYAARRKAKEVSVERWKKIVKEGIKMGVYEWELCGGGEPMAQKEKTMTIIELIKKNDPHAFCRMITNGLGFSEKDVSKLVKLQFDEIMISLEGTNAKNHDYLTNNKGGFNKIISMLENFQKYKKKYKLLYPKLVFNTIFTEFISENLKELIDLAKKYDISEIRLQRLELFQKTNRFMKQHQIKPKNFPYIEKELRIYEELANMYNINIEYDSILTYMDNSDFREHYSQLESYTKPGKSADLIHESKRSEEKHNPPAVFVEEKKMSPEEEQELTTFLTKYEKEWYKTISTLKQGKKYDKAISLIKKLLKKSKNNPVLFFQWGECLMEKKKYVEAIKQMKKAIEIRPKMNWVRFSIGKCYYLLKKYRESLKFLNANLQICKDTTSHFHSWYFKALNYEKKGNKTKTLYCIKQAAIFKRHFANDEILEEIELLKKYMPRQYFVFKVIKPKKKIINQKISMLNKNISSKISEFKEKQTEMKMKKEKAIDELKEKQKIIKSKKEKIKFFRQLLRALCYNPFYEIVIDPYGATAPCCVPGIGKASANIKNNSLKEVWTGKYFEKLRQDSLETRPQIFCKRCALVNQTHTIKEALKLSLDM